MATILCVIAVILDVFACIEDFIFEMIDQRGVKRSFCTLCDGEERCQEFERSEVTPFCGYCGCPPMKHKRVELLVMLSNTDEPNTSTISNENSISDDIPAIENDVTALTNSKEKENLNSLHLELPRFSSCVENALSNGSIHGPLWSNMIMQCAAYYSEHEMMKTKSTYEQVGRKMFDKYPCIEGPGLKPWSHFTKCLSQKLRTERMKLKAIKRKDFGAIVSDKDVASRKQASDGKKITFFRSEANVPSHLSEEEVLQAKQKIVAEWEKETPEMSVIKSSLRETFNHRTSLLKDGVSFQTFLENYPCFEDACYVLYEFSMLLGRNKMLEVSEKMKEFFGKLRKLNEAGPTEGDTMLSDWLWFEKKCGIFQTKGEKSAPVIKVVLDNAEYHTELTSSCDYPTGVLLLQENTVKDCAVVYGQHFIKCAQMNVVSLLTILLSLYYVLEINYPKKHVQAMGALACLILGHQYYRLGNRAAQTVRLIKDEKNS